MPVIASYRKDCLFSQGRTGEEAARWYVELLRREYPGDTFYLSTDHSYWHINRNDSGQCLTDPEGLAGPITDSAGYLNCGCHGSQPDHTCREREVPEYDPALEEDRDYEDPDYSDGFGNAYRTGPDVDYSSY